VKVKPSQRKVNDELALVKVALKSVIFYILIPHHTIFFVSIRSGLGLGLLSAAQENLTTDDSEDQDAKPRGRIVVWIFIKINKSKNPFFFKIFIGS